MKATRDIIGKLLLGLGMLFILNAIFGRYLVLPGYLASLDAGQATMGQATEAVGAWKVIRYLLWAYSFKLGIYLLILGYSFFTSMSVSRRWVIAVVGFVYIGFAYAPLPSPGSMIFGVGGVVATLFIGLIIRAWAKERTTLPEGAKSVSDYRMAAYFFFAMATYTLCPLLGVKAFALKPEKMIQYGLQTEAGSFAFHLLIELLLGWLFLFLAQRKSNSVAEVGSHNH